MRQRADQHFLHSVLCILWVTAHFHAEGEHSALKKTDCLIHGFRISSAEQLCGLDQLGAHTTFRSEKGGFTCFSIASMGDPGMRRTSGYA